METHTQSEERGTHTETEKPHTQTDKKKKTACVVNGKLFLKNLQKSQNRASLVAQWLRICLPMQGTRVRALVWEDPTCRGATRPVSHNY